ncbi:MAG: restriction endonuclease [Gammaproteobacteria bacterium]|nr:restriction endonuclease [Gammaproteobacteria bacterium]
MTRSDLQQHADICPYCGEPIEVTLDLSAGSARFIEDCPVCCQPIEHRLQVDPLDENYSLTLHRDDE